MDNKRFDDLTRTLSDGASRRSVLAALTGVVAAVLPLALSGEDASAKKRKKKKHSKHNNGGNPEPRPRPEPTSPPPPLGCTPNCTGKICGDDGCGGTCGACPGAQDVCQNGQCICVPRCAPANACGTNGCNGSCGTCAGPTCQGDTLTTNICTGGVCTPVQSSCAAGQICFENACCTKRPRPKCHKSPVSDGCGGTYPPNCGVQQHCCDDANGEPVCRSLPCQ
jgi:hypothetical protein